MSPHSSTCLTANWAGRGGCAAAEATQSQLFPRKHDGSQNSPSLEKQSQHLSSELPTVLYCRPWHKSQSRHTKCFLREGWEGLFVSLCRESVGGGWWRFHLVFGTVLEPDEKVWTAGRKVLNTSCIAVTSAFLKHWQASWICRPIKMVGLQLNTPHSVYISCR